MKHIALALIVVFIFGAAVYAAPSETIIDCELFLVTGGQTVDWAFQYGRPLQGKVKGALVLDEATSEPVWSAQGCINGYCFMSEGGPPEPIAEEAVVNCAMRLFVPTDFAEGVQALASLRLDKPDDLEPSLGVAKLYIKAIKPVRAFFVAGEKPVHVQQVQVDLCNVTKVLSEKIIISKTTPSIIGGSMMIPFRLLGDVIGAEVGWNATTSEASYTLGPKRVVLRKGIPKARIIFPGFEKSQAMSTAPVNIGGNIMVPLRFVSTALGGKVVWDSYTNTAIVTFPGCEE